MARPILTILILLSVPLQCLALTYWLHQSCESHDAHFDDDFSAAINEVKLMANTAKAKLADPSDQIMAQAFKIIFKVDRSNLLALGHVGGW